MGEHCVEYLVFVGILLLTAGDFPVLVGIVVVADDNVGVVVCCGRKLLKHVGRNPVVGVELDYIVSGGIPDADLPDSREALVLLADYSDAGLHGGEFAVQQILYDLDGTVRGPVIDNYDFEIIICLGKNASAALFDIFLDLIDGNDDRDERIFHGMVLFSGY